MSQVQHDPFAPSPAVPRLLVDLPPRTRVFFANLRDLVFHSEIPPLELRSAPAAFWHDVFVESGLPWHGFLRSTGFHVAAFALLIAFMRLFALQPHPTAKSALDHSQVIYYQRSEYLPPLDTREKGATQQGQSDPEFSRQPVLSVPREADNRSQTLATAPSVKLNRDITLPNIVAWSGRVEKPTLAIPAAPLTLAAELTRSAPQLENSIAPPPDAARLADRRRQSMLQASVVAPPPELHASRVSSLLDARQPAVVSPPPSVERASNRQLGQLEIGRSAVIAPAPQLALAEQRTAPAGHSSRLMGPQVVPPPPSVSVSGSSGQSFASRGGLIALNLHPSLRAPLDPPLGNRRGSFAATPEGRSGASGSLGSSTNRTTGGDGKENPKDTNHLPAGLYVGNAPAAKGSAITGDTGRRRPRPWSTRACWLAYGRRV